MAQPAEASRIEEMVRAYIAACNDADAGAIASCFGSQAVHYFPSRPKWSGAATIGDNFARMVEAGGYRWTVDQLLVDVSRAAAVLEWTMWSRQHGWATRGVDWFVFEPGTLRIQEVRTYAAAPLRPDLGRQELQDFDYAGRGYPT